MSQHRKKNRATLRIDAARPHSGHPPAPASTARSLREACRAVQLDQYGTRCRDCPIGDLCADESRWLLGRRPRLH